MGIGIIIFLVVLAGAIAFGVYQWVRSRPPPEEPIYYHKCTHCGRKLRYRAKQFGRKGMCPRCRTQFLFPAPPTPPAGK